MDRKELKRKIETISATLDVRKVKQAIDALLQEGEDIGGGINAFRLVRHLLGESELSQVEMVWAYRYIKPPLMAALEQIPDFVFVEGD